MGLQSLRHASTLSAGRGVLARLMAIGLALVLIGCGQAEVPPTSPSEGSIPAPDRTLVLPPDGSPPPTGPADDEDDERYEDNSSQGLIEKAVDDGELDFPTSLVYRAYALFGDPRLPEEYRGDGSSGEDQGLFLIPALMGNELPDDIRVQLEPYLVPPTHPSSIFAGAAEARSDAIPLAAIHPPLLPPLPPSQAVACDPNGWGSDRASVPIRIWVKCSGDYERDVAEAIRDAEAIWGPMTALMGPPKLDKGGADGEDPAGPDEAIDVYLTGDEVCPKNPQIPCYALNGNYGWAQVLDPRDADGPGRSGYLVVGRDMLQSDRDEFRKTLIHELFHVLQFAHVGPYLSFPGPRKDRAGNQIWRFFWFGDASAVWAEYHFEKLLGHTASAIAVLEDRHADFQTRGISLHSHRPDSHRYSAFIWPFFMVQRLGGPEAIPIAWRALAGKTTLAAAMNALDSRFSFRDHFADFAIANVNEDLGHGRDPLPVRFQKYEDRFPTGGPSGSHRRLLDLKPARDPYRLPERVRPLAATYWVLDVALDIKQLELDFSRLAPSELLQVDAFLLLPDNSSDSGLSWVHRPMPNGKTKFCRTLKDQEVWSAHVVLSNHDHSSKAVRGNIEIKALEEPCSGYRINFTYTGHGVSHPALGDDRADDISWMVTGEILPDESGEFDLVGTGTVSGTYWEATRFTSDGVEYCKRTDMHGTMILMGGIIGQGLLITGIPDEDMMAAGWGWLGLSEEVPVEGGTVAGERKSGLHQLPRDDPLPMYTCPGMADVTTVLEVTPLSE